MVAALVAAPQTTAGAAPNVGTWNGLGAPSALPSDLQNVAETAPPGARSVAVTDGIGGAGTDVWINNHAGAAEWFADGGFATALGPRDEEPGTPAVFDVDGFTRGLAFSDFNDDGVDDLFEVRAAGDANAITDGTTLTGTAPSAAAVGAEDAAGQSEFVLPLDMNWDGEMDALVGGIPGTGEVGANLFLGDGDLSFTAAADGASLVDGEVTLISMSRRGPGTPNVAITHNTFTVGLQTFSTNVAVPTLDGTQVPQVQGALQNANNIRDIALGDLDGDIDTVEYVVARINGEAPDGDIGDRPIVMGDLASGGPLTEINADNAADSCGTVAIADFDNDRDLDIFGGCSYDTQNNDILLENDGTGTFSLINLGASSADRSIAAAVLDHNDDGFMDVVVGKGFEGDGGADFLYTNGGGTNGFLQIDLDSSDNPDAMGAQVFVGSKGFADTASADDWQVREVAHSVHLAQDTRTLHFGLGQAQEIAPVVVVWPEGAVEACTLEDALNSRVTITQGGTNCETVADLAATLAAAPAYAPLVDERPTCFGEPITIALDQEIADMFNDEPFVVDFATSGTNCDDVILGTDAGETINGLGGNDLICAEGGDDIVNAGTGNDEVAGGDGDDFINGGDGVDRLFGQDGNDELNGEDGRDKLAGGSGDDELNGGADRDRLDGNRGKDTLNGGTGRDPLFGSSGNDIINGDEGNDRIRGGGGNDVINGNGGNDFIDGSNGDDTLNGNGGDDTMIGGEDTDTGNGGTGTNSCAADIETQKNC